MRGRVVIGAGIPRGMKMARTNDQKYRAPVAGTPTKAGNRHRWKKERKAKTAGKRSVAHTALEAGGIINRVFMGLRRRPKR